VITISSDFHAISGAVSAEPAAQPAAVPAPAPEPAPMRAQPVPELSRPKSSVAGLTQIFK
jgi:hypothetical protein